jgi:NAD(P)-dependent dehydrogenase (short-subunit alcohol dehydrogenase family)
MPPASKLVVITGASRGLGRAMALGFAARGCRVVGCARSAEALASLAVELKAKAGDRGADSWFASLDVADDLAVEGFAREVEARFGSPDLLLNSAALVNENAPLWKVPPEEFSALFDVNVKGSYHLIRHFLPGMIARRSGVVVNFSSGWGRSTSPEVAPYCATKWAIEGLTRALAEELPRGLAAVAFNPGIIDTEMLRSCFGEGAAHYPPPERWAETAVPYLESLGPRDNGKALTCPGH